MMPQHQSDKTSRQQRTDELVELKRTHKWRTRDIAVALSRDHGTVTHWLAPSSSNTIPERELVILRALAASGRRIDAPEWVHVGRRGDPLPTIENIAALLDFHGIDHCAMPINPHGDRRYCEISYLPHGLMAKDFHACNPLVEIASKCAAFELRISDHHLEQYLGMLVRRRLANCLDEASMYAAQSHIILEHLRRGNT